MTQPTQIMSGEVVPFRKNVKYLGSYLFANLLTHIEYVIKKSITALWTSRRQFGTTWGIKPHIAHWFYTPMVRLIIAYGAIVWWLKSLLRKTVPNSLNCREQKL